MTLHEELETLKTDDSQASDDLAQRRERVRGELEGIRARIKAGETTGDRIRDFALAHHGDDLSGSTAKIFRDLEARLAGKTGQLFVIAEHDRHFRDPFEETGGGCFGHPVRSEPVPDMLTMGLLSGDKLVLDMASGTWRIPCREFARGETHGCGERHDGPAFFASEESRWSFLLAKYGRPLDGPAAEIEAGDAEVLAWLKNRIHRYASDEVVLRRHVTSFTLRLTVPPGHFAYGERMRLREESFTRALALEEKILALRSDIEDPKSKLKPHALDKTVTEIRFVVSELGREVELSILLGIDPMRSEIRRLKEHFGRYWITQNK